MQPSNKQSGGSSEESEGDRAPQSRGSRKRPPRKRRPLPGQAFASVEDAADKLGLEPNALRARCRRVARREGDSIVARLGGGIVAFKLGRSWRFQFPEQGM